MINTLLRTSTAIVLTAAMLCLAAPARADGLTDQQKAIIAQARSVDGTLTHEMYDAFWKDFGPQGNNIQFRKVISSGLASYAAIGPTFDKAIWSCARDSWIAHARAQCADYEMAKPEAAKAMYRGDEHAPAIQQDEQLFADAAANAPVSNGKPLSLELIQHVLAGLDGSAARIKKLTSPQWTD